MLLIELHNPNVQSLIYKDIPPELYHLSKDANLKKLSPNIPKVTYTVLNGTTALGATSNICKYFYYNKKYLLNLNNT